MQQTVEQLLGRCEPASTTNSPLTSNGPAGEYRHVRERPNKGNKAVERCVISTFQVAQDLGFKGEFRQWEHLLRIHE